jgi:membrane-bound serine protease (ClpP class)
MKRRPLLLGLGAIAALASAFAPWGPAPAEVLVVPIVDEITHVQRMFVRRSVERAKVEKPKLVLFEIDTPGGEVTATLAMCEDIISLGAAGLRTAAFIKRTESGAFEAGAAASAGALISLACQKIYMADGTVIGAAQPVYFDPEEGMKSAPRKMISFLREKASTFAKRNGYPEHIAMAMVDPEHEVYRVSHDGKIVFVDPDEKAKIADSTVGDVESKLITKKGEPLTLTVTRAIEFGLAAAAETRDQVLQLEGLAGAGQAVESFTWSEELAAFLISGPVRALLMVMAILCVYMEYKSQTIGIFGGAAVLLFGIVYFGHYVAGMAGILEFILIVIGFALIAFEIFVIPGTMFSAILGSILVFTGLIMLMSPVSIPDIDNPFHIDGILGAGAQLVLTFLAATGIFLLIARFLPQIPIFNRLVLLAEIGGAGGAGSAAAPASAASPLVGRAGVVLARLAPGGKIETKEGEIFDVVAEGDFVEAGRRVRIVAVEGTRVVVRPE